MGCCSTSGEQLNFSSDESCADFIHKICLQGAKSLGLECISEFDKRNVDKVVFRLESLSLNALCFSIVISDTKLLKILREVFKASLINAQELLASQDLDLIQLIISYANQDMLSYIFPEYLSLIEENQFKEIETTIFFHSFHLPKPKLRCNFIHYACEVGSLDFILFVYNYFAENPPISFCIHAVDDETGENSALAATRGGNLEVMAFLFSKDVDFNIKNKRNESAIHLALQEDPKYPEKNYLALIVFLNEVAKIDLTEDYEESLLLAKDRAVIEYIELHLSLRNIFATKQMIDKKYIINLISAGKEASTESNSNFSMLSAISSITHVNSSFSEIYF